MDKLRAPNKNSQNLDLDDIFSNNKVFIDTCSLLIGNQEIKDFFDNVSPFIYKYKNPIIIPVKVLEELKKHSLSKNSELSNKSKYVLNLISSLKENSYVELRGEKQDNFADNVFLFVFTKFRLTHNLILITQDIGLSEDILNLNNSKSNKSNFKIKVLRFKFDGSLKFFKNLSKQTSSVLPKTRATQPIHNSFKLCTSITSEEDKIINIKSIPEEGQIAYTDSGPIKLLNRISSGGEGIIYTTNTKYVAKIYQKEKITFRRVKKIQLLIQKKLVFEGICFPIKELKNKEGDFVGYLMPHAHGKELARTLFIKPRFQEIFPGWKKIDTVKLSLTILKKIKFLHERNIIIGDINGSNILIDSPDVVFFVDTDSYQIEDLPCPVGTPYFTAPEIQGKKFPEFLRSMGNENFAVATLLFMIMLPGKAPYAQQGGENAINNIINMDFSYRLKDSYNGKAPSGPWRYMWSHLPFVIKENFYNTFSKNGNNSSENLRLDVSEWIRIFNLYFNMLESGTLGLQDKMSEEIYPMRFKNITTEDGKKTNNKVQSNIIDHKPCEICGNKIAITEQMIKEAKDKNKKIPSICFACLKKQQEIVETRTCSVCGDKFNIRRSEYDFFIKKGFELPKKCPKCRKKLKENTNPSEKKSSGIGFFSNIFNGLL